MATTRFYLDLRGKAKDGKGSILITVYHNGASATIPTGIRVLPGEWNGTSVVRNSNANFLNARLTKLKSDIDRKIGILSLDDAFESMTATQVKNNIVSKSVVRTKTSLVSDVFADYIAQPMREGTRDIYHATLKKVLAFGGIGLRIESIDLKWLHKFDSFLAKNQSVNGRAIYLRSLRAVCNYAKRTKVIDDYPFENFKIKHEETRKRSVTVEQLRQFRDYKVAPHLEVYRDYFFLMFYLIGINSKDLFMAKKDAIIKGRFEYIRSKTHKKYSIKIEPEAQALLDKYAGKDWLVEAMDHCKDYRNYAHQMNDGLKEIGEVSWEMIPNPDNLFEAPKVKKSITPVIEGISTYFSRHTWATLAYECGIPMDIISQALGHTTGNKTTLIYVRYDQSKIDEANRKVIDFLNGKVNSSEQQERTSPHEQ